jgi:hypothetical protein
VVRRLASSSVTGDGEWLAFMAVLLESYG